MSQAVSPSIPSSPTSVASGLARLALVAAALATALAALWLLSTVATVLPARDPGRVPFWTAVAIALLAYSALSLGAAWRGPRSGWLRLALLWASVAAMFVGGFEVAENLSPRPGGHFEGYLVLLGAIVAAHGIVAVAWIAGRRVRRT